MKLSIFYKIETITDTYLSIDIGLNNFATCVNNIGLRPFIINGRVLKSINQYYNKKKAMLMSFVGDKGISNKIGEILGKTGLSPNFFTFLVLVFGFIAAYFIYLGSFKWAIVFILISGLMDFVDGAVAKINKKETKFGALADSTADKTSEIVFYVALGLYNPELWLGASLAIAFFMLSSYISKHAKAIGGKGGGGIMERKERLILIILGLLFISYMPYILYIITFFSLITCLQRFFRNYKILQRI